MPREVAQLLQRYGTMSSSPMVRLVRT
jgi:hypothetical protein